LSQPGQVKTGSVFYTLFVLPFFYWFKGMFGKYLLDLFCLVLFQEKMGLANMALQKYKK
jgi:hypothetical protein